MAAQAEVRREKKERLRLNPWQYEKCYGQFLRQLSINMILLPNYNVPEGGKVAWN